MESSGLHASSDDAVEGDAKSVHSAMEEFLNNPSDGKWDDLVTKVKKNRKPSSPTLDPAQRKSPTPAARDVDVDELVAAALSAVPDVPDLAGSGRSPPRGVAGRVVRGDDPPGASIPSPAVFVDAEEGGGMESGKSSVSQEDWVRVSEEYREQIDFFPEKEGKNWGDKAHTMYNAQEESEEIEKNAAEIVDDPLDIPSSGTSGGRSGQICMPWQKWVACITGMVLTALMTAVAALVALRGAEEHHDVWGDESAAGNGPFDKKNPDGPFDLSKYGYPHTLTTDATDVGWISWPRDLDDDNFASFDAGDGVTSVEDCAAKCREIESDTGAWDRRYEACWCSFHWHETELCKEPCVEESYVGFSKWPIATAQFCAESVCAEDWFHSDSYCVDQVRFDEEECDAKIESLRKEGLQDWLEDEAAAQAPSSQEDQADGGRYSFKGKLVQEANLKRYGYPYVRRTNSSAGWLSRPHYVGITQAAAPNIERCMARCLESSASVGAFDETEEICWCSELNFGEADPADLCREPCVVATHVDFSTVRLDEFDYCQESVCDGVWKIGDACVIRDVEYSKGECEATIEALELLALGSSSPPAETNPAANVGLPIANAEEVDLSAYGYPYAQRTTSVGWVSWPKELTDDNFASFDATDRVTSLGVCAAKCFKMRAPMGAWDIADQACWCTFESVEDICKEPCVEEDFVNFSTLPFAEFDYCSMSVCDDGWHHSAEYCVEEGKFDENTCDATIEALVEAAVADAIDLSMYGYDYAQHTTSVGWVSWPPEVNNASLVSYEASDGVTSVEECAAKCSETTIGPSYPPVGAWDVSYKACFCSFVPVAHLCKEPCVEEEYVEFAVEPFSQFDYCVASVCDEGWYHSDSYCVDQIKFDKDACDVKIAALAYTSLTGDTPATVSAAPSTTALATAPESAQYLDIQPSAMATTKLSSPDAKNDLNFSVENGDERVSFVRFDLSSISESYFIESATLQLYLVRSIADSENENSFPVVVDALPQSSEDWSTGSVSYNEPLDASGGFFVASFTTFPLGSGVEKMLYTVDVSSAIDASRKSITLMLSTHYDVRLDFAGEKWNDGEDLPNLRVAYTEPTNKPTVSPTKEPTNDPTEEPSFYPSSSPIAPAAPKPISAEKIELAMYGYPYVQYTTSLGWVSWPKQIDGDNFASFDDGDGVTSLEECADQCQQVNADIGSWDITDEACWCASADLKDLCKEPCVEEENVQFAVGPFSQFGYCEKSVCDDEWHHSDQYCVDIAKFDETVCDEKIQALASYSSYASVSPTASPTTSATSPKHTGSVVSQIDLDASAMATTKVSSPDAKDDGLKWLGVEDREERVSFVRFDLTSISENKVVDRATLHLNLVRSIADSDEEDTFTVYVHALSQSSEDWSTGSVSYNEPLEIGGEFLVESFEVALLDSGTEKKMYAVDVTSAIDNSQQAVTFKLWTDSDVRLDFAGQKWNDGEALPWLRVRYTESTHPSN